MSTLRESFSDLKKFIQKELKTVSVDLCVVLTCYQALVKGGASSQTMAADEFIVGAAEVLVEQV